jgi:phosphohistidine phosphatase
MRCYFLRHGLAGDRETWTGDDFVRPLTPEGRDRMKREAAAIDDLGLGLDLIVTSPRLRAKQTAQIVADRLKMNDRFVEDERLDIGLDADRLRATLEAHADASSIMVVGHEPSMSDTIGTILGGGRIELKKGGLACVELQDASASAGTLIFSIPPKILATFEKR